jgi:activating signal cointegrator complex subunit 3
LTAFDIISYAARDEDPKMFLGCSDQYIEELARRLDDEALRHTVTFGIGLHHAGLSSFDRETVEKLFLNGQIRVLVATATLAWGVNLPAHLVIVKGRWVSQGLSILFALAKVSHLSKEPSILMARPLAMWTIP